MAKPKIKDVRINIKTTSKIKEAAEQAASADNKTLTAYLESLIVQDTQKSVD